MKVEKINIGNDEGKNRLTFCYIKETNFHEKVVAVSALGLYVVQRRVKPQERLAPAMLAVKIQNEDAQIEKDGETISQSTSNVLASDEIALLTNALSEFAEDAPAGIKHEFVTKGAHGSINRTIEVSMAESMLSELQIAGFEPEVIGTQRFGLGARQ
jgi:hypothetical protein